MVSMRQHSVHTHKESLKKDSHSTHTVYQWDEIFTLYKRVNQPYMSQKFVATVALPLPTSGWVKAVKMLLNVPYMSRKLQ